MTIISTARRAGLGLALALSLTAPATAGDWNNGAGSIKDYGGAGGVPVPAPVPVPEYAAQWYFRGDLGIGFGANPSVSRSGQPFGATDAPGPITGPGQAFGYGDTGYNGEVAWPSYVDEKEFSPSYMFGVGVGRYVTNRFRIDVTGEYRGDHDAEALGSYRYWSHAVDCCGNYTPVNDGAVPPNNTLLVDGTFSDKTRIRSGLFMLNGYWDLMQRGHFTPYVGAGIGFSLNENERSMTGTETETLVCNPGCGPVERATYNGSVKSVTTSLAAAFMAGISYNIAANTKLDLNYRYLYVGGYDVNMNITRNQGLITSTTASTLKIGDQHEHQIRAGLRWDIN
ncbi:MAG: opacity family porin [Hyphomicrobiaceae bacterium]